MEFKELKRRYITSYRYWKHEKHKPGDYYSLKAFDYYKCIFVHIPKAAGISVNKALFGNFGGAHRSVKDYKDYYHPSTFDKYYKFTFVRNPWDRVYSAFNFLKKGGINRWDHNFMMKNLKDITSFEEFVIEWLYNEPKNTYQHFKPQVEFIWDENKNCPMDFIGRFENIDADFQIVANKIRSNANLKKLNSSHISKAYTSMYTNEMIEKIENIYKNDIEFLNYNFD